MAGLLDQEQANKSQLLRSLLFAFEADAARDPQSAQTSLLGLRCFLEAEASASDQAKHYLRNIRDFADANALKLQKAQPLQNERSKIVHKCFQAAGLPRDFTFACKQANDPLSSLRATEPFSTLLSLKTDVPQALAPSTASRHAKHSPDSSRRPVPPHHCPGNPGAGKASLMPLPAGQAAGRKSMVPCSRSAPSVEAPRGCTRAAGQDRKRNALEEQWANSSRSAWQPAPVVPTPMPDQDMEECQDDGGGGHMQESKDPFQTAKSKLVSDLRKKGVAYNPKEYSSGNMFAGGTAGPARTGLSRPAGNKSLGARKPAGSGGVRGGFVPPFVKKGLQAPGANVGSGGSEEDEGPLSARTKALLAGPDGELPESLQRHDPQMIEQVCNDVLAQGANVTWEDIAGLETAKKLIQELVVWPMQNPHLFTGARAPPKGLLLFGPPGTGKTLVGKAIASEVNATFFNISASSLTSKWMGEGEKMVCALFAVAGCLQPAVIFIDEIDSILSMRKSDGEHEASRRLKTEMLVQMEGCDPNSKDRRVLLVGATNRPEELDEAARRRMPKQLYIPLPCDLARRQMIDRQLGPGGSVKAALSEADVVKILSKTAGYSGSDMRNLVQEACQGPVRDAVLRHGSSLAHLCEDDLRPVNIRDFQVAAKAQRASVQPEEIARYEQYNEKHGAKYMDSGLEDTMDEDDW